MFLETVRARLQQGRAMAEKALAQVDDEIFFHVPRAESNSIAVIVKHLGGNHLSRWTDFLSSDGEKPDRNRDDEFVIANSDTREVLMQLWERGWEAFQSTLASLGEADLTRTIKIRGEDHSVMDAILRAYGHASYHIGQIVYLCKLQHTGDWTWMTIPPGGTEEFNRKMAEKFGAS